MERFPNGLPREVNSAQEIDGVLHVFQDGVLTPVWSDYRITVELRHNLVSMREPKRAWARDASAPIVSSDGPAYYENTEEDAMASARAEQDRLEKLGHFVPIYVRD